jgi:AraC-like DNA-binding protein
VIAALVTRMEDRFVLRRELRTLGEVRFAKDSAGLLTLVRECRVRLVITEPRDPKRREAAPAVRAIRSAYPSIPVLILCNPTADDIHLLVDLVRSGADDAIVRGVDRVGSAAAGLLARGEQTPLVTTALADLGEVLTGDARAILAYAIANPAARKPVEQVARTLGVSRRTLVNRLSAAGLARPSVFVAWGRLLVAAASLEDSATTVRDVARTLGLRSNAGLHVLCRRHSCLSVRALRRGGYRAVLDLVRRELLGVGSVPQRSMAPANKQERRTTRRPRRTAASLGDAVPRAGNS